MWRPSLFLAAALAVPSQALHFFIDGAVAKCFFEELPKDTMVVGHYEAQIWDDHTKSYQSNADVGVFITVEETFDNNHRIVAQRGHSKGKFTFSAADSGEHRLCFTPQNVASTGWFGSSGVHGTVKFNLDMAIGETSKIESNDKTKIDEMVQKVMDLNSRLHDIVREQTFQRARESEFRDQSESTNARVVRWTLIQLAVLGITCAWQLSHLRAFFIKQKLT
ncbi:emp24/gp25L/p24 family/GOLD-domain-containing protein [Dendryphion nanum]|uniref:Emp24/gp25L/p24 family/GOLD-domain-containing protein n=1 Tax=Dendryphion nanum TaxID=256645 RepID=A0A9P9IKB9_9PLEO|nr:emp24/gp25L/p24 family/GOLD-domain-containing protein [Dendryphion nanum]